MTPQYKYEIGQRIYFSGELGNPWGRGTVIKRFPGNKLRGNYYSISLDDGRMLNFVREDHFDDKMGKRFWVDNTAQ